jgi:DNA-binding CsgD family transcriptional regulator
MKKEQIERLEVKTPEQRFLRVLKQEFHQAPRVAEAVLEEAQSCLLGQAQVMRPGQVRVILARRKAGHGRGLDEMETTEVVWTVDAGREDRQVLRRHGRLALRQVRIQRLLDEALAQGAVGTQEDLARALQVTVRTIKRDCADLKAQGIYLPTRGNLHGIGRGQTHKAQIVGRWLRGETYDQIALHMHHSLSSIRRYVQTFVRVVHLHHRSFSQDQIALLLQISQPLVKEYLAVYRQHDAPEYRERLAAHLQRLARDKTAQRSQKGAQ